MVTSYISKSFLEDINKIILTYVQMTRDGIGN